MKVQSLFSGKNKKNLINFLSAEFAQRVVSTNIKGPDTADLGLACSCNLGPVAQS